MSKLTFHCNVTGRHISFREHERPAGGGEDNSSELSNEDAADSDSDHSLYLRKKNIALKSKAPAKVDTGPADPLKNGPHEMQVCIMIPRTV